MYLIGDEEIAALKKLFEKKRLYRYQGQYQSECDAFEAEFSKYVGTEYSLLLSSGTNALILALLASGIQPGDEVLIPTYTFVATAAAVLHAGGIPVLVNIDKNLSMDFVDAQTKLSNKTKAIILVHMDGLVADVKTAKLFCEKNNLKFIEDVAQAIGGTYENKFLGSFGDAGCFSLNENKNISCGEGGIFITSDREMYEKAFCLHDGPAQFNPNKKGFFKEIVPFMGMSMRVSEIQGTIMRVQLSRLNFILSELKLRKQIFTEQIKNLDSIELVRGYSIGECHSSLHLQFADPERGLHYTKKLREAGLLFASVLSRPAHASWKWSHLLGEKSNLQPQFNPYKHTNKTFQYPMFDYLPSVEILTKTQKLDIDFNLTLTETKSLALTLGKILSDN